MAPCKGSKPNNRLDYWMEEDAAERCIHHLWPPTRPHQNSSRCPATLRLRRCTPLTLMSIHPMRGFLFMQAPSGVLNWDRAERCADWLLDKHCCWLQAAASSTTLKMERRRPQRDKRMAVLFSYCLAFFLPVHLFRCVSLQLTANGAQQTQ